MIKPAKSRIKRSIPSKTAAKIISSDKSKKKNTHFYNYPPPLILFHSLTHHLLIGLAPLLGGGTGDVEHLVASLDAEVAGFERPLAIVTYKS